MWRLCGTRRGRMREREREREKKWDHRTIGSHWNWGKWGLLLFFSSFSPAPHYPTFSFFLSSFSFSLLRTRGERISSENKIKKNRKAWTINTFRFYVCVCVCIFQNFSTLNGNVKKNERNQKKSKGTKSFFLYTLFLCGSWLNQLYLYFIKFYLDEKSVRDGTITSSWPAGTSTDLFAWIYNNTTHAGINSKPFFFFPKRRYRLCVYLQREPFLMVAHKKKNTHNNIHRTCVCVCVCLSTIYRTLRPFLFSSFSFQFELRSEEGLLFSFEMSIESPAVVVHIILIHDVWFEYFFGVFLLLLCAGTIENLSRNLVTRSDKTLNSRRRPFIVIVFFFSFLYDNVIYGIIHGAKRMKL